MLGLYSHIQQFGQRMLTQQAAQTAQAAARLGSGKRINSAKDDAAGLQISNRLMTQTLANQQLQKNLEDGISYSQTASDAISQISDIVQRMRTLAIQAVNGSNNDDDRTALDNEYQLLAKNINNIASQTEIFGKHPLMSNQAATGENINQIKTLDNVLSQNIQINLASGLKSVASIPAGSSNVSITLNSGNKDDDIELFATDGTHIVGTGLSDNVWINNGVTNTATINSKFILAANGFDNTATYSASSLVNSGTTNYNGSVISYSGDQHSSGTYTETLTINYATEDLILAVVGTGTFYISASWDQIGTSDSAELLNYNDGTGFQVAAKENLGNSNNFITVNNTPSDTSHLGLDNTKINPADSAESSINALDSALEKLNTYQGYHGGKINAFESTSRNAQQAAINQSSAKMRIQDADFAIETAKLNSAAMLEQATSAVLSHVNSNSSLAIDMLINNLKN